MLLRVLSQNDTHTRLFSLSLVGSQAKAEKRRAEKKRARRRASAVRHDEASVAALPPASAPRQVGRSADGSMPIV